tara:strand:- start:4359 stop:4556 length:198 start_codon:yes stop_codon:yes gene_type:complete
MSGSDTNALEYLNASIRENMNEVTDVLAVGGASDFAEYRYQCGVIQGLAIAERELLDIKKKIEDA